jgi:hypothetical protein
MITNNDISNLSEANNQTVSNIKNLQTTEMELFVALEKGIAQKTLALNDQNSIVKKINEISQIRINLYKNLNGQTGFYSDNITSSMGTLQQQKQSLYIVESELNEAKRRLALIEEDKNNKSRLIEINTYYGDRYGDYSEMMKTIVIVCLPVILLAYLAKLGFLPTSLYIMLLVILVVIIVIYMFWKVAYLYYHDNMNYQEYNWSVTTSKYPKYNDSSSPSINPWSSTPSTCVGEKCCMCGSSFDSTLNRCVPNSMSSCPLYESSQPTSSSPISSSPISSSPSLLSNLYDNLTL